MLRSLTSCYDANQPPPDASDFQSECGTVGASRGCMRVNEVGVGRVIGSVCEVNWMTGYQVLEWV